MKAYWKQKYKHHLFMDLYPALYLKQAYEVADIHYELENLKG